MAENTTTASPVNTESITPSSTPMGEVNKPTPSPGTTNSAANPDGTIVSANIPPAPTEDVVVDDVLVAQKAQEADIIKQQTDTASLVKTRQAEDTAIKDENIATATNYADDKEKQIKKTDKAIDKVQDNINDLAKERAVRDTDIIKTEQEAVAVRQEAEIEKANASAELQTVKDDNAILAAEASTELALQQSAWAFNKLGLGFSSGIILETQSIATQGATAIAELKVQANYNQASISVEVASLMEEINATQVAYTKEINSTIDKYTDVQLENEQDIISRIDSTNTNLLLTEAEKQSTITALKAEWNESQRTIEDDYRTETERLADKNVTVAKDIEVRQQEIITQGKQNLDETVVSGTVMQLSASELSQKEVELGMAQGTIFSKVTTAVSTEISAQFEQYIGEDYIASNVNTLTTQAKTLMSNGYTFAEAINKVMASELKTNERYQAQQTLTNAEIADATAEATQTGAYTPVASSTSTVPDNIDTVVADIVRSGIMTDAEARQQIKSGNESYLMTRWNEAKSIGLNKTITEGTASYDAINAKWGNEIEDLTADLSADATYKQKIKDNNQTPGANDPLLGGATEAVADWISSDRYQEGIENKITDLGTKMDTAGVPKAKQEEYFSSIIEKNNIDGVYIKNNAVYINDKGFDDKIIKFTD